MDKKTLIVIGGGAAGFFCAVTAARLNPSLNVVILEKSGKLLSKVRVSGGGRCNVTHACFEISEMVRRYPRGANFLKRAFHQFFTSDTVSWFEQRGVQLKTEADGRIFPVTNSSETIISCLLREADRNHVGIRLNKEVKQLERNENAWKVHLQDEVLNADFVSVACGGYSKITQFRWLLDLGLNVEAPVPSLFTFNLPDHPIRQLMGVSTEARVKITGQKLAETGPLLITHWGLSGPAVLRLSAWGAHSLAAASYDFDITVNWVPSMPEADVRANILGQRSQSSQKKVTAQPLFGLPARLWQFLCSQAGIDGITRWADLAGANQQRLIALLTNHGLHVKGKTGFKEEFVTAGGIGLQEINVNSMESRKLPGLYFAGEILDVDGITGGFNFQHAWTSGFIAGKHIATQAKT